MGAGLIPINFQRSPKRHPAQRCRMDKLGLSEQEAANRLREEGFNELPARYRRTLIRIVMEILREPMFALLLAAGAVYLAIGDLREAVILFAFACTSVGIAIVQEARTERVLESCAILRAARPRRPRRQGDAHSRAEVVTRRPHRPCRGRPGAGRRQRGRGARSLDRQIAANGRVGAGAQGGRDYRSHRPQGGLAATICRMSFRASLVVRGRGRAIVTATGPRSGIGGSALRTSKHRDRAAAPQGRDRAPGAPLRRSQPQRSPRLPCRFTAFCAADGSLQY